MDNKEPKYMNYFKALINCFREEEDRLPLEKFEIEAGMDLTGDFLAMFQAIYALYCETVENKDIDILDFTYMINRMVVTNCTITSDTNDEDIEVSEVTQ